jgi:ATP-dependent helicase/nuclease subunit A
MQTQTGTAMSRHFPDGAARERALAPEQSFIVRAPAGSGKTELLTRRFLKLLASVDEPEEVLAITFTRAATAEMRARVLGYLAKASSRNPEHGEEECITLARGALARSYERGWEILDQSHRLNIETIDSLCLRIAHNQPLLSRMGGGLSPIDDAQEFYAQAARRTLGLLGSANCELNEALSQLLALRDSSLPDCERLLAEMLEHRDQWIRAFPLSRAIQEGDWDRARSRLEQPFREEVKRAHGVVYGLLMAEPLLASELMVLTQYACDHGYAKVAPLAGIRALPSPETALTEHWRCISDFLLTNGNWRTGRGFHKGSGFPSDTAEEKRMRQRVGDLLTRLQRIPYLREALCVVLSLPEPHYEEAQWETLRHIFTVLRQAVAELRVFFAERGEVDFTELGIAAREVLGNAEASPDLLLALSGNIHHLLVDEFQDTSRSQHELLKLLVRAWESGDGRSCFLVGDPMQSIYLFRQAEVELFEQVTRDGLVSEEHTIPLESLELSTNYRSHEGLTTRWNEIFDLVFEPRAGGATHIEYSHTFASQRALRGEEVHVYPQIVGDAGRSVEPDERERAEQDEAEQVLRIIAQHEGRIQRAIEDGQEYRVAVLVRSRPHLARIVALLRERGVAFRAVELEKLSERQELLDLLSLMRALLHPMDRIAWLSVLRAPWCGLGLEDLHVLTGADDRAFRNTPVLELIESQMPLLSSDGAARLQRVSAILKRAIALRFDGPYAMSFTQWIERTWRSLGGAQCIDAAAYENVQTFFSMLDAMTPDGINCLSKDIDAEMERLYAQPDPAVSERAGVQLMTIHKAKGLGFDVVIVPGLDRQTAQDTQPLISSLERTNAATGEPEMLVAPIGYRGGATHPTYKWVQRQISQRADEELKRLLYVACTRARRSVHLLGTATMTKSGLKPEFSNSLLAAAWPALHGDFEKAWQTRQDKLIPFPERRYEQLVLDLAAGADPEPQNEPRSKLLLRRLPVDADLTPHGRNVTFAGASADGTEPVWVRPEGSREARQKGSVVHALLELLSRGVPVDSLHNTARSMLRGFAYFGKALEDGVAETMTAVRNCVNDPDGAWVLASHSQGQSEASWTGWMGGELETLRADRVFIAGAAPSHPGEDHLWIVDYKLSEPAGDANFLVHQREIYAPQLARYARALREAQRIELPVCVGLYYPRIPQLDWWRAEKT